MLGSANASTVLSMAISSTGSISTASATQARRGVALDSRPDAAVGIEADGHGDSWRMVLRERIYLGVDGALGQAGHDGVDDLDAGSALPVRPS